MKLKIFYGTAIVVWLFLCLYTLWDYQSSFGTLDSIDGELYTVFFIKMTALSFPLGLILIFLLELILGAIDGQSYLFVWFFMSLAGFLQWFVITPWLWNKVKEIRGQIY